MSTPGCVDAHARPISAEAKKCTWQQNAARIGPLPHGDTSDTAAPAGSTFSKPPCFAATVSVTGSPVAAQRETTCAVWPINIGKKKRIECAPRVQAPAADIERVRCLSQREPVPDYVAVIVPFHIDGVTQHRRDALARPCERRGKRGGRYGTSLRQLAQERDE
nr:MULTISPECIES: hypothetical protein [Burkholderia]